MLCLSQHQTKEVFCMQLLKVCRSCQVLFEMLSVTWSRLPGWVAFPVKHSSYFSCWAFLLLLLLFWYQSGFDSQGKCWQTELLEFHVLDHAEQCLNIWNSAISACVIAVSESEYLMCSFLFSFFFFFELKKKSFLFKPSADFFKGKTVFNHWLPGICYSNITFQLVSEATFNKSTLVEYSGVRHESKQHRTGKEDNCVPFVPYLYVCFPFCHGRRLTAHGGGAVWHQLWDLLLARNMGGGYCSW